MNARYLIWSNQQRAWWGPNRVGYTPYVEAAGRYQLHEAQTIVAGATVEGQLRHTVEGTQGEPVTVVDEVLLLAPESLQQLLAAVGHALDTGAEDVDLDDETAASRT